MNEEEKKAIKKFVEKCNKFDESVEIKGVSVGEEYRILETVCKTLDLVEKLKKKNEELKIKNNAIKRESEAYAEKMIRLDIEKQDYFEKYRYHLQQNESLTKEFSNVIPVQKVKDKIEKEIKYHEKNILDIENITMLKSKTAKEEAEIEFNKYAIVVLNKMLQELIEESEEK